MYDIGTPLFGRVTLHLAGGRELVLRAKGVSPGNRYVKRVLVNGSKHDGLQLSHELLMKGGTIDFEMDSACPVADVQRDGNRTDFFLKDIVFSKGKVRPDEKFYVRFVLGNNGSPGTKIVRVMDGRRVAGVKHCLVEQGQMVTDSVECRLYAFGRHNLRLEGADLQQVADASGYSRNQISYLLNQVLGQSFYRYVNQARLQHLMASLDNDSIEATIDELAFNAGFNSLSAFYKCFREHTGLTPKAYLKQISLRART